MDIDKPSDLLEVSNDLKRQIDVTHCRKPNFSLADNKTQYGGFKHQVPEEAYEEEQDHLTRAFFPICCEMTKTAG